MESKKALLFFLTKSSKIMHGNYYTPETPDEKTITIPTWYGYKTFTITEFIITIIMYLFIGLVFGLLLLGAYIMIGALTFGFTYNG